MIPRDGTLAAWRPTEPFFFQKYKKCRLVYYRKILNPCVLGFCKNAFAGLPAWVGPAGDWCGTVNGPSFHCNGHRAALDGIDMHPSKKLSISPLMHVVFITLSCTSAKFFFLNFATTVSTCSSADSIDCACTRESNLQLAEVNFPHPCSSPQVSRLPPAFLDGLRGPPPKHLSARTACPSGCRNNRRIF